MERIQAVRGMNDILPDQVAWWKQVEEVARDVLEAFGFQEIRTPLMEKLELFARSIGEGTDIVEKEMYTFTDSKGQLLALRPEATASVVRAYIEHNLRANPALRKFYTIGPMFRHERPQKGRYRQFHQIDAEVFGLEDPMVDAEMIYLIDHLLGQVGLTERRICINTLGCRICRTTYRKRLQEFLDQRSDELCPDCQRRRHINPLRSFDCKVDRCGQVLAEAPVIIDALCAQCAEHFQRVQEYLGMLGVSFEIDPRMVRGLDYYTRTAFEVITDRLGAQNAVGGGGRYDGLMRELGGPDLPAIGFAIGMERLILLLQQERSISGWHPDIFVAALGTKARQTAFRLVQELRVQRIATEMDYEGSSLKSQMRRAGKLKVPYVLIIGDDELAEGKAVLRDMEEKSQVHVPLDELVPSIVDVVRRYRMKARDSGLK